jgi:hypothetical protein
MKALLVLVLLSMVSAANAASYVQLACSSASAHSLTTLRKEGKIFKMQKSTHTATGVRQTVTTLYVEKSGKTALNETMYAGLAETQVQVDVFDKQRFVLRIPENLENKAVLTLSDDFGDGMEQVSKISFECSRPDNR